MLQELLINDYTCQSGQIITTNLSYELVGRPLHSAPIILINHALTGNSNVGGTNGWWKTLLGPEKTIDTNHFTVLCFNIPGNGYDGKIFNNSEQFCINDIAALFLLGLKKLKIEQLFAIIGGSIGGAIAWEMTALQPTITQKLIPIATDHQTSDWLNAHCMVQKYLLQLPEENLEKARIHAMLCYRTPDSINKRFGNAIETKTSKRKSEEWLLYHGKTLKKRYKKESYQLMNHLLTTIDVDIHKIVNSSVEIHLIAIDTDLYFPTKTIRETYHLFNKNHKNTSYHEIISEYGHDAFLIEYEQLNKILTPIFNYYEQPYHYHLQEQSTY